MPPAVPASGRRRRWRSCESKFGAVAVASRRVGLSLALVRSLISKHGRKWTFIGSELNRLPCSCRDKWRLVKKIDSTLSESSDWFIEEDEALVSIIMKSERLDIIGADADDRSDHSWLLIAEKLHVQIWVWNVLNVP